MLKEILLPDLGEGIFSADVSEVLVSPEDHVSVDDIILVLESEKASMEIPSEEEGVIKKVFISAGDQVKIGEILIMMEVVPSSKVTKKKTEEKVEPKKQKDQKTIPTPKEKPKPELKTKNNAFASPGVRKLARELEIVLSQVKATGPKGRITKEDLHGYIKQKMAQSIGVNIQPQAKIDFSKWGEIETQNNKEQHITTQNTKD